MKHEVRVSLKPWTSIDARGVFCRGSLLLYVLDTFVMASATQPVYMYCKRHFVGLLKNDTPDYLRP